MDQIGSEIGQKMRCAVKAKLNEMEAGTYIDEELPDYVMILLVNKKSREAMEEALNLFLGEHTTAFVSWLHDVLGRLEKVSVPQRKRKVSEGEEKQKKDKKKQKNDEELPALPSITEVIKEGFIQRSKKELEIPVEVKKKEDDFDIPTITDIAKEAKEKKQAEDLTQLKEIQEKIYMAKKQLRTMVSESESDEETPKTPPPPPRAKIHVNPQFLRRNEKFTPKPKETEPERRENESKVIKISSIRRAEREIYIPKHRRGMLAMQERSSNRSRSPPRRSRTPPRRSRTPPRRSRSPIRQNRQKVDLRQDLSRRIHSRVTVVPSKPVSDEEIQHTSVSSVIRIKPRTIPKVQASKMLLLRAVADAQKSTTHIQLARPKSAQRPDLRQKISVHVPEVDRYEEEDDDIIDDVENDIEDEEYIPEPITRTSESSDTEVYVPRKSTRIDDEYDPIKTQPKTQFVVTLTGAKSRLGQRKTTSPTEEEKKRPVKERIGYRFNYHEDEETKKRRKERFDRGYEKIEKHRTPTPPPAPKISRESDCSNDSGSRPPSSQNFQHPKLKEVKNIDGTRSLTPPVRRDRARTISPINFDLTDEEIQSHDDDSDFESRINKEKENAAKQQPVEKKSTIKKLESSKKFDNVPPLLSTVTVASEKSKERCRFFPNCRDVENCEYHHPSTPCIAFPACRFGDSCLYLHPPCRFDELCKKPDCPYSHTVPIIISVTKGTAPLLASSVVPVQNYKSLNVTPLPPMCRFGPSCSRPDCIFYHPKPCKFGIHCKNRIECNFYHGNLELPTKDKLTWKPH